MLIFLNVKIVTRWRWFVLMLWSWNLMNVLVGTWFCGSGVIRICRNRLMFCRVRAGLCLLSGRLIVGCIRREAVVVLRKLLGGNCRRGTRLIGL